MKNMGIIRRIDDLGRIVIPKEIRRTLNINEGDPLEIQDAEFIVEDRTKNYGHNRVPCGKYILNK